MQKTNVEINEYLAEKLETKQEKNGKSKIRRCKKVKKEAELVDLRGWIKTFAENYYVDK